MSSVHGDAETVHGEERRSIHVCPPVGAVPLGLSRVVTQPPRGGRTDPGERGSVVIILVLVIRVAVVFTCKGGPLGLAVLRKE